MHPSGTLIEAHLIKIILPLVSAWPLPVITNCALSCFQSSFRSSFILPAYYEQPVGLIAARLAWPDSTSDHLSSLATLV